MVGSFDWNDLKVFLQVARAGSLQGASRTLRLDHSTVSRRIAALESALGLALFERLPTGLRISPAGARLLPHAELAERASIGIHEELLPEARGIAGRVRLATMEGIASLYLAPRLLALRDANPSLMVELVTSADRVSVNRREADIFLSFFQPQGHGHRLVTEQVGRFALGLHASAAYLARHGTPQQPADLARHHFVSYVDELVQLDAVRWLNDLLPAPALSFCSNSMIAQMGAASGGLGIVLLPSFASAVRPELLPVLPGVMRTTRALWLSVHEDLQFSPRIRVLVEFLRALFSADQAMQVAQ